MRRRLVVDGQIFQTPAWHRGMGRYSLDLLQALSDPSISNNWESRALLLSSKQPSSPAMIKELHDRLLNFDIVKLPLVANRIGDESIPIRNRKLVDRYLASMQTDDETVEFLILSLMQGEIYSVFPSDKRVKKIVLFYDLVPLVFFKMYLQNPITRMEYLSKVKELLKADVYVTISQTVANDLSLELGIDVSRIVSIDGGPGTESADPKFKMSVPKRYILMPTGNDLRKNNARAIQGFESFNRKHSNRYKLLITSYFKEDQIKQLRKLSANVVFTGNVSNQELNYLYSRCEILLFPTEYEGLGMPIIEALENDKPVACSDIPVFREMSQTAFTYFNPYVIGEIESALEGATAGSTIDQHEYARILAKYTWPETAKKYVRATREAAIYNPTGGAKSLAIFAPNTNGPNQTGQFVLKANSELSRKMDCSYYLDPASGVEEQRINYLPYITGCDVIAPGLGFDPDRYDRVIFVMDNSADSAGVLFAALAVSGVVLLMDGRLDKAWKGMLSKGLIDSTRFDAERQLQREYDLSENLGLVSLLCRQESVVVFGAGAKSIMKDILLKARAKARLYIVDRPQGQLVYPNAVSTTPDESLKATSYRDFAAAISKIVEANI